MAGRALIRCVWTGRELIPDGNWATALVHDRLGQGEVVQVELDPDRSRATHNHYFAIIQRAWETLPEGAKDAPFARDAETLRKHALIATGWRDTDMIAVGTEQRADRVAGFAARMAQRLHGYAITSVEGAVVYVHTPRSQSQKAMGRAAFQQSKQDVIDWLARLLGTDAETLAAAGKEAA